MNYDDQHANLVRFLEDTLRLDELTEGPEALVLSHVVQLNPGKINIGRGSRVDSFVKLEGGEGLVIGRYVHIASFAHIGIGGGTTLIEDYAAVASGGKVISGSNQTDAPTMSAVAPRSLQRVVRMMTTLGKWSCVCTNAVVLPGVKLGEGAVLAAGAVAVKDIPDWEVWGGVPARFIAKRAVQR
jgi:acetyltransferase-like isoleucine patch superfamily enzyme